MKLLADGEKAIHDGYADLAAEDAESVHESGECGGRRGAVQRALFQAHENDAADKPDINAGESGGEHKFHGLKAGSRPRGIEMGANQGARGHDG